MTQVQNVQNQWQQLYM